jgi:hypothetical protein
VEFVRDERKWLGRSASQKDANKVHLVTINGSKILRLKVFHIVIFKNFSLLTSRVISLTTVHYFLILFLLPNKSKILELL